MSGEVILPERVDVSPEGREKIMRLQDEVGKLPQWEMNPTHYFAKGLCGRELVIPKGTVVVGRVHLQSQINIILRGDITVWTEHGPKRLQGPCAFVSPEGVKRAVYTHEETVWLTILGTDETDPEVIKEKLTAVSYDDYERICAERLRLEVKQCPGE